MRSFFDWFHQSVQADDPWLLLGKGPSFALRGRLDLSPYRTLSLNHAVREQPVLVAHVIDLDVIEACGEALERNAGVVVMPWYPHVGNEVGARTLDHYAGQVPALSRLRSQGRLLWYDLSTSPVRFGAGPVVEATYFSAEAAVNLLALAGARRVRSLGVDGGSDYSGAFEDLRDVTRLSAGQSSFDLQFQGIARTILTTGIDFAPLDRPAPVLIYSMYSPDEALPLAVLEHSIRRRASLSVEFVPLTERDAVAERGPALVFPPRALVRGDVRRLWPVSLADRELLVPSLTNGAAVALAGAGLAQAIPAIASAMRRGAPLAELDLPVPLAEWSSPAGSSSDKTLPLCFPPDGSEPWLSRRHPLAHLWCGDLLEGIRHGSIPISHVADGVGRGHVRPSLLYQVEHGIQEPSLLPRRARQLDYEFHATSAERAREPAWSTVFGAVGRGLMQRMFELRRWGGVLYRKCRRGPVLRGWPSA